MKSLTREPNPLRAYRDALLALAARVIPATARLDVITNSLGECSGSAWMYDAQHWVTNHHVIDEAGSDIRLTNAGRSIRGAVVGSDPGTDLALIRTEPQRGVPPLPVRSMPARLGEPCFAFGAPLGTFPDSMTSGIVSGLERRLPNTLGTSIEDVLQTDAAINHGNSGGPLVDVDGEVIGVNTAGIDQADNIGFAVPAATVSSVIAELIAHGSVLRASLGASLEVRASANGPQEELAIVSLRDGHSALRPGDVLISINGLAMRRRADLFNVLRRDLVGKRTPVEVQRAGKKQTVQVVFNERRAG